MRKTYTVMALVMALALSMVGTALAEAPPLPSTGTILDSDGLEIEVAEFACPTTDLPAGVTGVATTPPEYGAVDVYIIPWQFDGTDHGGLESYLWTASSAAEEVLIGEGNLSSPGADGNWYPRYPNAYTENTIVYTFGDSTTYTARADFDANGCITAVSWASNIYVPSSNVSITFTGDTALQAGDTGSYTATVTNTGDASQWVKIGVEFQGDAPESITVAGHNLETFIQGNVVYFYRNAANVAADGGELVLNFQATFAAAGSFTGTAYALDAS